MWLCGIAALGGGSALCYSNHWRQTLRNSLPPFASISLMTAAQIGILILLVGLLQSSSLASEVSKTFKATPEQVFAAAEKALRENSRVISVKPIQPQLKIQFRGPRLSALEQYSALSGEASISQSTAGKCLLTISVADVHVSSAGSYSQSLDPAMAQASEKNFVNSMLRRVRRILGQ